MTKQPTPVKQEASAAELEGLELSRLFIVCGRDRTADELRSLFSTCGTIKHLHLALDRSKKSRGFAFLQYEDPADAAVAIERLDHLKLQDGHVLKVTVAKERPAEGHGRLKRDQHARHECNEKTERAVRKGDDGIDARLFGKRQRSSPPVAIAPSISNQGALPTALEKEDIRSNIGKVARWEVKKINADRNLSSNLPGTKQLTRPDKVFEEVEQVVHSMVLAVEQIVAQTKGSNALLPVYKQLVARGADHLHMRSEKLAFTCKKEFDEENSTESLTSSIRSVSLVSTSSIMQHSPFDALPTLKVSDRKRGAMPALRSNCHLRRRRQSLDYSGSSAEDTSDSSNVRRKRSNTANTSSSTITLSSPIKVPVDVCSESCHMSESQEDIRGELLSKRLCKRQSSDSVGEKSYRLVKQQTTQERQEHDGGCADRGFARRNTISMNMKYEADQDTKIKLETEPVEPARTKLFFTSTHKFTEQELEAMFAVYGDFNSVKLVKSFGRVQTMAYICFSKPCTAAFVVKSFKEESSQGDEDPERPEYMSLSFAHIPGNRRLQQQTKPAQWRLERALDCASEVIPSLDLASKAAPSVVSSGGIDRLWVLLLYDRYLATHVISSVVSSYSGMEFMDIKVIKSTGEAQGVAFVKFDREANATHAALQLHQMELPLGSGKYLQAIVIQAPSLFTTTHGKNTINIDESMKLSRLADERIITGSSEDVDLHAVEAQFAHLMRCTEPPHTREGHQYNVYSSMPLPRNSTPSDHVPPLSAADMHPFASSGEFYPPVGVKYYPMPPMVSYPPSPPLYPYANCRGEISQQPPQHQQYGGWMDPASCYPDQYPFSCTPKQGFKYLERCTNSVRSAALSPSPSKPRSARLPSVQMDAEGSNSNCSSQISSSVHISTSKPLELVTLAHALQNCSGIVSFAKVGATEFDSTGYRVVFTNEALAVEALRKLDNSICGGQKLRVSKVSLSRHRGNWGKARTGGSGRRKRQRIDLRSRK